MNLLTPAIEIIIQTEIIQKFADQQPELAVVAIGEMLEAIYADIPDKKRISYGRYSVLKDFAKYLYPKLLENNLPVLKIGVSIFEFGTPHSVRGLGLALLSYYGLEDYGAIWPYFETAAQSDDWILREHAQGLFRKVVKQYRDEIRPYLFMLVRGNNANLRRFVVECLRPVVENRWLHTDYDYSLTILRELFQEPHPYPRTAVGNNLSDIARRDPELVYNLVVELVALADKNAYWIAYRACRNLVKTDPIRVMDLLGVDEYRYKQRTHRRADPLPKSTN
jgi:3-methyladenine DNA glycosylase AlkC